MKKTGLIAIFVLAALSLGSVTGAALSAHTAPLHSGDRMPDGTVYVDVSPDTHKPFYTTPADAPGVYNMPGAEQYCSALEAFGHKDWRMATRDELNVEFNHRAAIGGFDLSGSFETGWYWSFLPYNHLGWGQRFSDGYQRNRFRDYDLALRCVR